MRATAQISEDGGVIPKRTPLILLWTFATFIWTLINPPRKTFPARILLLQIAWPLRLLLSDATWIQDLALFLSLNAVYGYFTEAWRFPTYTDIAWIDFTDDTTQLWLQTFELLGLCGTLAGSIVLRGQYLDSKTSTESESAGNNSIEEQVLPPLLIPSRTTHTRVFPKKHAFSYSYLFVGIPVGVHGRICKMLSVDSESRGWFVIDSNDYLDRGVSQSTLAQKLKRYLHTQGVTDRDYAFAYLVTAPRFLGYSFNPVSFWYLYDSDTYLKYMILEVNNTFDERRMYFLRAGEPKATDDHEDDHSASAKRADAIQVNGTGGSSRQLIFTESWPKDFHVSPFNSRKGSYSLKAIDPLAAFENTGHISIDNTIVMRSSKDHAKFVARVFSVGEPKDPSELSAFEAARFVFAWCWVGFATSPRIVWEASKLFFRRNLHVWYRPEVTPASIGRPYTEDEKSLEAFFRAFLSAAVTEASKPIRITYEPAHSAATEIVFYSPDYTYEEDQKRTLVLKVLSPAFYSRFVHYKTTREALEKECLATDERSRTAHLDRTDLLPTLLGAVNDLSTITAKRKGKINALERARWVVLQRLRCAPSNASYTNELVSKRLDTVRTSTGSELDAFVKNNCEDSHAYRKICTKLFLAELMAGGIPSLILALDWLVRSTLLLSSLLYSDKSHHVNVLPWGKQDAQDLRGYAVVVLLANAVHIWGLIKG